MEQKRKDSLTVGEKGGGVISEDVISVAASNKLRKDSNMELRIKSQVSFNDQGGAPSRTEVAFT